MKIKVTKKMSSELNKYAKTHGLPYEFVYIECSLDIYRTFINIDFWNAYDYGDYDPEKSIFKAIQVNYPPEFYALPYYLTTQELNKIAIYIDKKSNSTIKYNDFMNEIMETVAI